MHRSSGIRRVFARLRPHAALVAAVAAGLVIIAGGSATAASLITSSQIATGAVGRAQISTDAVNADELCDRADPCGPGVQWYNIAPGAVGTGILADGGVHMADLGDDVTSQLGKGEKGDKGDPGEPGKDGKDGKDGVSGYEVVGPETAWQPHAGTQTAVARCPEGKVLIGGGYTTDNASTQADQTNSAVQLVANGPDPESLVKTDDGVWQATAWRVTGFNAGARKFQMQPFALCAAVN